MWNTGKLPDVAHGGTPGQPFKGGFYLGISETTHLECSTRIIAGVVKHCIIRILWVILVLEVACCNNWDSWSLMPFLWLEMCLNCLNFSQNSRKRKECFAKHVEVSWNGGAKSSILFSDFPWNKPSSYWGSPIYGTPWTPLVNFPV